MDSSPIWKQRSSYKEKGSVVFLHRLIKNWSIMEVDPKSIGNPFCHAPMGFSLNSGVSSIKKF